MLELLKNIENTKTSDQLRSEIRGFISNKIGPLTKEEETKQWFLREESLEVIYTIKPHLHGTITEDMESGNYIKNDRLFEIYLSDVWEKQPAVGSHPKKYNLVNIYNALENAVSTNKTTEAIRALKEKYSQLKDEKDNKIYIATLDGYSGQVIGTYRSKQIAEVDIGFLREDTVPFTEEEFEGVGPENLISCYWSDDGPISIWEASIIDEIIIR
tara:strand:- start:6805 stop:7446 length:642 start_codon:yes stop_codon:yes gene_type:complete